MLQAAVAFLGGPNLAATCDAVKTLYRDEVCCGDGNKAICVAPSVDLANIANMSPLTSCQKALQTPDCTPLESWAGANTGSFECTQPCSAADFSDLNPLQFVKQEALDEDAQTGLMWARAATHDGDHVFVQMSRKGLFGGQYGPTTAHGRLLKISKATGKVVARAAIDGRWAPVVYGGHVYQTHSHFLAHQDMNGAPIAPFATSVSAGRVGHWIFKLNKDTLAIEDKRELSVDLDIVEPRVSEQDRLATDFSSVEQVKQKYLSNIVGTTQLNGPLGVVPGHTECPNGVGILVGVSGYPYYFGFSDEEQNRPLGFYGQRNHGRGQLICSTTLSPMWTNPASNGWTQVPSATEENGNPADAAKYLGSGKKRALLVGDKIPPQKKRADHTLIGVTSEFDCAGGATHVQYPVSKLLAIKKTFGLSAPLGVSLTANNTVLLGCGTKDDGGSKLCKYVAARDHLSTDVELEVEIDGAEFDVVDTNAVILAAFVSDSLRATRLKKVTIDPGHVTVAAENSGDCFRWKNTVNFVPMTLTVAADNTVIVPKTDLCATITHAGRNGAAPNPSCTVPDFKPLIKTLKQVGDTIDSEGERVSLQQHGGSFWFKAAVSDKHFITPTGNGHMESVDRYFIFRSFYRARDVLHKAVNAAATALEASDSPTTRAAFYAAKSALRAHVDTFRTQAFDKLSELDKAGVESSISAYDLNTGARAWVKTVEAPDVWNVDISVIDYGTLYSVEAETAAQFADRVGYWSHLDAEANNAMYIAAHNAVVYTSKGAGFGVVDADSGAARFSNVTALWSKKAEGTSAASNFGGACYPGGSIAVVRAATNAFPFINPVTKELVAKDHAVLAAFEINTGKFMWYKDIDTVDTATGLVCGNGFVFTTIHDKNAYGVFDARNGNLVQTFPIKSGAAYNDNTAVIDGKQAYFVNVNDVRIFNFTN